MAATWVDYLDGHARRLYSVELDPARAAAQELAEHIQAGDVPAGTSLRNIGRKKWAGLTTVEFVNSAAESLQALGWVRIEEDPTGGRPPQILRLHPDLDRGGI